jgi:Mrp family chromosome partitioning ATPase/capsular polysaccharide biosynthesis protein
MQQSEHPSNEPRQSWLASRPPRAEFSRYLQLVRSHWAVVVAFMVAGLAAAFAYSSLSAKSYTAEADLLVTPVSADDPNLVGLPLVRQTADPTADVLTVAKLVTSPEVASAVATQLGGKPNELVSHINAAPVTQSEIIAVQATASSASRAAALANAFAQQTVQARTNAMHAQLATLIPSLRATMHGLSAGEQGGLAGQLAVLETLRVSPDPTLRVSSNATPPTAPSTSRTVAMAAGGFAGFVLGLLAVLGIQALDPKLRDEDQLREIYDLPMLARVPRQRSGGTPLTPRELTAHVSDAFRTLRSGFTVKQTDDGPGHAILVTGDTVGDGKTTVALNLAAALVAAGNQVMLIESDLRRPSIGRALKLRAPHCVADVLNGRVELASALVWMRPYGPQLEFLLAGGVEADEVDRIAPASVRKLVREACAICDFVVIDAPPLTDVADALPFARAADDVLLVARLGNSRLHKMSDLGELLTREEIMPSGVVVVGSTESAGYYYSYSSGRTALWGLLHRRGDEPAEATQNGNSTRAPNGSRVG